MDTLEVALNRRCPGNHRKGEMGEMGVSPNYSEIARFRLELGDAAPAAHSISGTHLSGTGEKRFSTTMRIGWILEDIRPGVPKDWMASACLLLDEQSFPSGAGEPPMDC